MAQGNQQDRKQQQQVAVQQDVPTQNFNTVQRLLAQQETQIKRALPSHMSPERMARIVTTELRKNSELLLCDPISLFGAVIQCAQLGLEPGNGLGHAWLVPFYNKHRGCKEVQFIPGYRGLIDLARRSGQVARVEARCVYEGDFFEWEYGFSQQLRHKPMGENDQEKIVAVWAGAALINADGRPFNQLTDFQFEVMPKDQIDKVKASAKASPIWRDWYDEMARKTVVRRLVKYLPISVELAAVLKLDDKAFAGESQELAAIVDPKHEPKGGVTDDATNVVDISAELGAENAQARQEEAKAAFLALVGEKMKAGVTADQIKQACGEAPQELARRGADNLYNAMEVVRELQPAKAK